MKKDWEIKKLGDVCEIIGGTTPSTTNKSYWNGTEKWITPAEIDINKKYIYDSVRHITKEAVKACSLQLQPKGTVIFTSRAPIGKVAISEMEFYCNQGFKNFICSERILNEYLYYFLIGNVDYLNSIGKGTTFKEISKTTVSQVEIPLPPIEEQKRIVKILDEKFAQLETIKTNAQTNLQNAKDLFQPQLTKAFSNTAWEKKRLGDLCSKIGSGATPKGGKDSYKSGGIHLVRSMNVYDSKFVYDELACIDDKQAYELRNVELQENDVLFNITGASVCRCCVLPSEVLPARVNQHVSILRPKQEQLNPTFLCSAMLGYKEILYKMACVGGSTRQAITKSQLEDFEIPLPPLPDQKRIVKELDTISEKVRQLQEIYTKQIADCDELKQAYLQKAFEGEL